MSKLLIAHGGGPTAVINASLWGAVTQALGSRQVDGVWGAVHGSAGILKEEFVDLGALPESTLEGLLHAPASAIGTSRTPLYEKEYAQMAEVLQRHDIGYVLFTGGNGSMDTCGKLNRICKDRGIVVGGIPKTIDNDLGGTDHAPGYASAARFAAQTMLEIATDVDSMPIHVCIVEYMGRNTGWITAATALARTAGAQAPHLILLPEVPFRKDRFLERVRSHWARGGGVMVAVSEGLCFEDGTPVAPPIYKTDRATYFGDVSGELTRMVIEELGVKARSEKPGILGRSCPEMVSPIDREEAIRMGALAAKAVLAGKGGFMPGLKRLSHQPYACEEILIPVEQVMLHERLFPREFISEDGMDVTPAFLEWAAPLVGDLTPYVNLRTPMADLHTK